MSENITEDFSIRNKLSDVGRWCVTNFVKRVAKELPKESSLLDAGAGESVYKQYFSHCDYKAIDLAVGESRWNYENLDYVGFLHEMPIENDTFDNVLCTQVLEHLEWPRESVKEMHRVLKPKGKLHMTVPMAHAEHQVPYDFFRYTSYGLKSICEHAGFKDIRVKPFGGTGMRLAYELPNLLMAIPNFRKTNGKISLKGFLFRPLKLMAFLMIRLLQIICLWADKYDIDKKYPFGWECVATK